MKLFPNFTRHHLITHTNLLGSKTLIEQRLSEILYSVFKLVNNNTNPESLNELSHYEKQHMPQFLAVSGAQDLEQFA